MRRISFWLVIVLSVVAGVFLYTQQNLFSQNNTVIKEPPAKKKEVSLNDLYLYAQKTKALDQVIPSEVYYSAMVETLGANSYRIDIYLLGADTMRIDAADLSLILPDNLVLEKTLKGTSFPSYPRLVAGSNRVIVTGAASIGGNLVKLGEPNRVFLSLIVSKKNRDKVDTITVDPENTKAFLKGEPVLNRAASINSIEF